MNPWLQRFLIALGASVATTTLVVGTAKNKHKKAKRRRRKKSDPPLVLGTVAKRDGADDFVPGLTGKQWLQGIKDGGQAFVDFITRKKKPVIDDGGLVPDEVVAKDGTRLKVDKTKAKRKLTPSQLRRQRRREAGKRKQASLFDSAKESFRQVVKEEASKAIDEKVESTGLNKVGDALKTAGEKVGGAVKDAATKIKEGIPEDTQEQVKGGLQSAGKSFLAGAKKLGQSVSQTLQSLQQEVSSSSSSSSLQDSAQDALPGDAIDSSSALQTIEPPPAVTPPPAPSIPSEGFTAEQTGEKVGDKVQDGVQKIGAFLSGPGNPGYKKGGRIGSGGGDVVEAKDPPPKEPPGA
ncbi:MAG: hypothetical protein Q8O67_23585 [Deltaproteobacteria bacterium]|nr:hypothetical protein [Deltaproteobacteria bacterium]